MKDFKRSTFQLPMQSTWIAQPRDGVDSHIRLCRERIRSEFHGTQKKWCREPDESCQHLTPFADQQAEKNDPMKGTGHLNKMGTRSFPHLSQV